MKFLPFSEARQYVHNLQLKNVKEWERYCKSGKKPDDIPANPNDVYENWKDWGDWLGTGTVATQDRQYGPFEQAREYARSLGLNSQDDWQNYSKSGKKPDDIPSHPDIMYKKDWKGFPDWLGYEEKSWSLNKIKDLLRDLIASKIIYEWNEAVLYSFLIRKGLLSLQLSNRHSQFFRNLIEASHTEEGRKAIERYANSDSEIPPDLSKFSSTHQIAVIDDEQNEIQAASPQEITNYRRKRPIRLWRNSDS